jgi:CheY-like chemotaxis protein
MKISLTPKFSTNEPPTGGPRETIPAKPASEKLPEDNFRFNILIADNNLLIGEILGLCLQKEGYKISAFNNYKDALKELQTKPFNLLITNHSPDGRELISVFKEQFPQSKALLFTGNAFAEKGEADDLLIKPSTIPLLLDKVKQLLTESEK